MAGACKWAETARTQFLGQGESSGTKVGGVLGGLITWLWGFIWCGAF